MVSEKIRRILVAVYLIVAFLEILVSVVPRVLTPGLEEPVSAL